MTGYLAGYIVLILGVLCMAGYVLERQPSRPQQRWGERLVSSVAAVLVVLGFIATVFSEQIGYYQ